MALVVEMSIDSTSDEVGEIIAVQIGLMRINSWFAHSHLNWIKIGGSIHSVNFKTSDVVSPLRYHHSNLTGKRAIVSEIHFLLHRKCGTFYFHWHAFLIHFNNYISYRYSHETLSTFYASAISQSHIDIRHVVIHLFLLRKCHLCCFFFHSFALLLLFRASGEYCVIFSIIMSLVSKIADRFCCHNKCTGNCFEFREFVSVQ